jgi:predicted DNA-binding transcriptional regulator AlpA
MEAVMNKIDLLTVPELARELKVKPSWVYGETRKTGKGSIPRFKIGKYLRFSLEEVIFWIREQNEQEAP